MELLRRLAIAAHYLHVIVAAENQPVNTPAPMLEPAFASCEQFHLASEGEDCNPLIAASGLTRAEFFRVNPAIGGEDHCQDKIVPNFWYCVRAQAANSRGSPPNHAIPHHELPLPTPTATNGAGDGTGDEPDSPEPEVPEMTPGPKSAKHCAFGQCWIEFAKLSFEGEDVQRHAAEMCTSIFNYGCQDHEALDFPDGVKKGCKNCEEISSGCPCYTESKYHTWTNLQMYHPGWRSRMAPQP